MSILTRRLARPAAAWLFAACALNATGAELDADASPTAWLEAMDDAFRSLDYDGTFTYYAANQAQQITVQRTAPGANLSISSFSAGYRSNASLATFRIVHKVVDGVERERVEHLNSPWSREMLRTGDEVTAILQPGDDLLALKDAIPAGPYARVFARRFEGVGEHYQAAFIGRGRVAGRAAVALAVTPLDADRFGYRLLLDEETALLLRSELRDAEGTSLEIFEFAELRIGDSVAADLEPTVEGATVRHFGAATPAAAANDESSWAARWVPRGFRMTAADVRRRPDDPKDVDTLVFSDGLAAFTVFIEAMPETGAGSVVSRRGATVALTHLAQTPQGDHLVTVVGEVPVPTARRIAAGIQQRL